MNHLPLLAGFVTLCLAVTATATANQQAESGVLRVPLEWQLEQEGSYAHQPLASTKRAPRGVLLPEFLGETPFFSSVPFGDQQQLQVIVEFEKGIPKLWVDCNFNQDFTDEQAFVWTRKQGAWVCPVVVQAPFAGSPRPIAIELEFRCQVDAPLETLEYMAKAHKRGAVVLGDRLRTLVLLDENSELDFSATLGVALLVDIDGDGFLASAHGSHEHFHAGERFQIGAQAWDTRVVGRAAGSIILVPAEASPQAQQQPLPWQPAPTPQVARKASAGGSVALLLAQYEHEKREVLRDRTSTVFEIGRVGSRAAFALLEKIARTDSDPKLQRRAILAMGRPEYLDFGKAWMMELAHGARPSFVKPALTALYLMRDPDFGSFLERLSRSKRPTVVAHAALFLGYHGTPQSLKVANALLEHAHLEVRLNAYQGLRATLHGPSTRVMLKLVEDKSYDLRALALLDLLATQSSQTFAKARQATGYYNHKSQLFNEAVVTVLTASASKGNVQAAFNFVLADPWRSLDGIAVERLASLRSDAALASFRAELASHEPTRRLLAAQIFGQMGGDYAYERLAKQLQVESNQAVADVIVHAMGSSGSEAAVAVLIKNAQRQGPLRLPSIVALGKFGMQQTQVRTFLLGLLESDYWEDRVLAIEAIALSSEKAFGNAIVPSIRHASWQVRLAAIEALRKLRCQAAVAPLVEQMQREDHVRLRQALGQTLFMLTGQNPHLSAEAWNGWWQTSAASFRMSDTVPKPRAAGGTVSKSGFYGLSLDSDHVVFVIDQSGSMDASAPPDEYMVNVSNRLEQALANAMRSIEILDDRAMVNVVLFSSGVQHWRDGLQSLNKKNRKSLMNFLDVQGPEGGTNLFDGLKFALQQVGVDRVLLLSDGEPTAGRFTATEDILREVQRINQANNVIIDCVALGMQSPLLKRLAEENGGRYIER